MAVRSVIAFTPPTAAISPAPQKFTDGASRPATMTLVDRNRTGDDKSRFLAFLQRPSICRHFHVVIDENTGGREI